VQDSGVANVERPQRQVYFRVGKGENRLFMEMSPERKPADWIALGGVVLTVALHFVLQAGGPNPYFIAGACLFWTAFVVVRARRHPGAFREWGFRGDNLARASLLPALLFTVSAAGFAVCAAARGHFRFPLHALPLFLLYPVWGTIQQFLALGIVVNNLERIDGLERQPALVALIAAVIFGAVHAHDLRLAAGTFALELVLVPLYLRERNVWPLGVCTAGWAACSISGC
jgi:hypothetical protein